MDIKPIRTLAEIVKNNMLGRMAMEHDNAVIMAQYAARHGNHLEIGALHGGSAILVALVKKLYGYAGRVVCIDPLDGYYGEKVDPVSRIQVTPNIIMENARRFCVADRLKIIQSRSIPFPECGTFSTAYIDGDHWNGTPLEDWNNVKQVTREFVFFDNCDLKHPDVMAACETAGNQWIPEYRDDILFGVRNG